MTHNNESFRSTLNDINHKLMLSCLRSPPTHMPTRHIQANQIIENSNRSILMTSCDF